MKASIATTILTVAAFQLLAQEPVVRRAQIWLDTVKRGDMVVAVRGLGVITTNTTAEVKIAQSQAGQLQLGQPAFVDTRQGFIITGEVAHIDPTVAKGTVAVSIRLEGTPSTVPSAGTPVDGTIQITRLVDIIYVGRPVFGRANSDMTLFKMDADGRAATRVKERFGQTSVNTIQILEGLMPGDRVILSDMSAYEQFNRLRFE